MSEKLRADECDFALRPASRMTSLGFGSAMRLNIWKQAEIELRRYAWNGCHPDLPELKKACGECSEDAMTTARRMHQRITFWVGTGSLCFSDLRWIRSPLSPGHCPSGHCGDVEQTKIAASAQAMAISESHESSCSSGWSLRRCPSPSASPCNHREVGRCDWDFESS